MKNLRCLITGLVFIILAGTTAFAVENDPPSRVARLKYINGQVSIQPGGVDDWVAAAINRPLTTSDRVWTDRDSRAELELGSAAMRMNSETSLTLSNLTDGTVQVELNQGTLNLRVGRLFKGEIYEVDTPNLAFTILKAGNYRFDVDADGDQSFVTVWNGEGEATGNGSAVRLRSHERARFEHGNTLAHQVNEAPRTDGFDDWCLVRDKREESVLSSRYVAPDVIGYEDLDEYGSWRVLPAYGPVWVPAVVAPGWAPYRFGHWVWVSPWGWTWVDDAPWGFAPFHYGRWVYYSGFWGWCPGPFGVRAVYAPALVGWIGGPAFGVGFGFGGGVGWFPLGFGEPFIPYYRASRGYFRNVNIRNTRIVNITNITNNYYNNSTNITHIKYVNQAVPGATTIVPARTLVNAEPVATRAMAVPAGQLRTAAVVQRPGVTPSARSVLGVNAGAATTTPPARVMERPVVSKVTPPARPAPIVAKTAGDEGRFAGTQPTNQPANQPQRGGVVGPGNANPGVNAGAPTGKPANTTSVMQGAAAARTVPNESVNRADTTDRPRFPVSVPRPGDKTAGTGQVGSESPNHVVPRPPVNGGHTATPADNTTTPASRTEGFRQGSQGPGNAAVERSAPRLGGDVARQPSGTPAVTRPAETNSTGAAPHAPAAAVEAGTAVRPNAPRQNQEYRPVPRPQESNSGAAVRETPHSEPTPRAPAKTESAPKTAEPKSDSKASDVKQRTFARPPISSPGDSPARSNTVPRPPRATPASYTVPRPPASQSFSGSRSGYSPAPAQVWRGSSGYASRSYAGSAGGYGSRSYAAGGYTSRSYAGNGYTPHSSAGGYTPRSYAGGGGYSRSQSSGAGRSYGAGPSSRGGSSSHSAGGGSRSARAM
jgi:hypothetical protein